MPAPADEYRARLERRRVEHQRCIRVDARHAAARLAAFFAAIAVGVAAARDLLPWIALAAPVLVFVFLMRRHDAVIRAKEAAARAVTFYEHGLARLEDRWMGTGTSGERFADPAHLYANDLDLFGRGSLFELLSRARTEGGEELLASWLKAPAAPAVVASRQEAVRELSGRLDFREGLAVAGTAARADVQRESLVAWATAPALLGPPLLRWCAFALSAGAIGAVTWWFSTGDATPAVVIVILELLLAVPLRRRLERAIAGTEAAAHELDILAHLLARIEREPVRTPRLAELRRQIDAGGVHASATVRALDRLVELHDWEHNLIFLVISIPLLWRLHVAFAVERWRVRHGARVPVWIAAVAEFEALSSFGGYAYEHPDDPFPQISAPADGTRPVGRFDGTALGHPLLPAARMVRNDVRLDDQTRLVVVSGSNMSGKSTLLRTAGVNAVLALAGAPVRAASLTLSPLTVGATLRIQDSLQEGRSRFYAEISRIRELADAANGQVPLLFLLDELFHGTNSHDRLVGASGVLRSLLDRGAIGLITTHDLALTAIADELAPRAANIHFEDWFDEGEIRFDYRAKPGRVTRSNALSLMRAVGLDV